MYKAIVKIGEYEIGDEIPAEQALIWIKQYAVPQLEEVPDESTKKVEVVKEEKTTTTGSSMLEDYLARKGSIVKKNILEDEITTEQLEELLKLEKSDKNRYAVINAIEKRLAD